MFDFLFELNEYSDNEGEQFLCEAPTLDAAYNYLVELYGFEYKELNFIMRVSVEEGETLGLDTY